MCLLLNKRKTKEDQCRHLPLKIFEKWEDVRAIVLGWHPNQADVSRGSLNETIIANGKRLEELERAEKMRLEELERAEKMRLEELGRAEKIRLEELITEQALKEKELQLKFNLERFKMESGFRVNDEPNDSTNTCSVTSNLNFKKLILDFHTKQSDISLYLVIFERQTKRAAIEKKEWVGQLLGLLPLEIVQFIAREPDNKPKIMIM
ncbi:hypothetical protein TNCV_2995761 [Trichonephila clavipes]|nr:hypothetical protein TNCV_2995761 [Trichonephila clavipes]